MKNKRQTIWLCIAVMCLAGCTSTSAPAPEAPAPASTPVEEVIIESLPTPTQPAPAVIASSTADQPEPDDQPANAALLRQSFFVDAGSGSPASGVFSAPAGTVIRVNFLRDDGLSATSATLIGPSGNALASVELGLGEGSASIAEYTLPFDGEYTLQLAAVEGSVSITVEVLELMAASGGGSLEGVGASSSATLAAPQTYHLYRVPLMAGTALSVLAAGADGSAVDTYLSVYDNTGAVLAEVDDTSPESGFDAVLEAWIVPQDAEYLLVVSNVGETTGAYDLILRSNTEAAATQANPDLIYGSPYRATFADGSPLSASFDGTVGDVLRISAFEASETLNIDIFLISPFEQIVAYAAGFPAGEDEVIREVQLAYTGRYTLELRPTGDGEATFTIEQLPVEALSGGGVFGQEAQGSRAGRIDGPGVFHAYQFEASVGSQVDIRISSFTPPDAEAEEPVDLGFALIGPDGRQIAFADDAEPGVDLDPALTGVSISQAGSYLIVVYSLNASPGQYELAFERR